MVKALEHTVFTQAQIKMTVERMAGDIAGWAARCGFREIHLVSVLEGARPFTRDLSFHLKGLLTDTNLVVHEIHVRGTEGTNLLESRDWRGSDLNGIPLTSLPVLIVDDLADSGKTLALLKSKVEALGASPVKTAVLLRKFGRASGEADFLGFDLNLSREELGLKGLRDLWLFGYGMDLDGQKREWEHIGWVEIK